MSHSRDVIVFAGALYDAPLWTNRQQIATRLADRGWRVLYVEPRLLIWRQLFGRFQGTRGRLNWVLRQIAPQQVRSNLWVQAQANLIPGSRHIQMIGRLNHILWNGWHVHLHAWELGFRNSALLIYDTEAAEFLDDFPNARVVYDCVDDHRAQAGVSKNAELVAREESALASRADAIAVTTQPLFERFSKTHQDVHLAPNAADVDAFLAKPAQEPQDIASIPHPRIGTVGALDAYKVDVEMLHEVIEKNPQWQFVLVGPVEYAGSRQQGAGGRGATTTDRTTAYRLPPAALFMENLRSLPNVHFLDWKPKEETPAYVHAFDVAIIPYRESPYNRASFPLKFWEFLAAGKPVVASGLPSLEPYRHLVTLASSPDAYTRGIQDALTYGTKGRGSRIAEAQTHSWESRVNTLEQLLS